LPIGFIKMFFRKKRKRNENSSRIFKKLPSMARTKNLAKANKPVMYYHYLIGVRLSHALTRARFFGIKEKIKFLLILNENIDIFRKMEYNFIKRADEPLKNRSPDLIFSFWRIPFSSIGIPSKAIRSLFLFLRNSNV